MVAHPAVVERLNWMMGPGWAESPASASVNRPGAGGQQIHGAPEYGRTAANAYHAAAMSHLQATQVIPHPEPEGKAFSAVLLTPGVRNARQVNYHWVLRDVEPGDGPCLSPPAFSVLARVSLEACRACNAQEDFASSRAA